AVPCTKNCKRIVLRSVVEAQNDDRAHLGPQRAWIAAALRRGRHPGHVAMGAFGEEPGEIRLRPGNRFRPDDPDTIETMSLRSGKDRRLECFGQKSRSA